MSTIILEEKALISASGHLISICLFVHWKYWTNSPYRFKTVQLLFMLTTVNFRWNKNKSKFLSMENVDLVLQF